MAKDLDPIWKALSDPTRREILDAAILAANPLLKAKSARLIVLLIALSPGAAAAVD